MSSVIEEKKLEEHTVNTLEVSKEESSQAVEQLDLEENKNNNEDDDIQLSSFRKNMIVFTLSISVFLAPMSSMSFLPAVPTISAYFHTTGTVINISNAVYNLVMAISPCLLNPLCDIYGRRLTFLVFLFFFMIATVLTAVSQNLAMFFVFRAMSALFGTTFFGVSALIIGDLFRPTERGTAQGWTLLGSQIGPTMGPVIGGVIVSYYHWRFIFWVQVILIGLEFILAWFFIPETMKKTNYGLLKKINYNPFRILFAFKYKNLILAGVVSSSIHYGMYTMLTPITYVMNPRFNLTTPVLSSLFYLPVGAGYIVGAAFGGRYADYTVKKYITKRGHRVSEDRLYSMVAGYVFFLPITSLIYGWSLEKKKGGIVLPVLALFFNGAGQTLCYSSNNTYCIDCMPQELKSDSIGGNYFIRFIFAAIGTATVLTEVEHIGIGWTSTISVFFFVVGIVCLFWLIKYGSSYRPNTEENEKD